MMKTKAIKKNITQSKFNKAYLIGLLLSGVFLMSSVISGVAFI